MLFSRVFQLRRIFWVIVYSVSSIVVFLSFQEDIQNLYHHFRYHAHCKVYPTRPLITDKQRFKRVLFYTPYFDNDIWPRAKLGSSWNLTREDGKACAHTCVISYNKCDLPFSDAVIFHEADLFRAHVLKSISIYRNPQQRWVYFTHENPQNANHDPSQYNGIFNWTVTYRRDSDVFYPDGYYREILSPDEIPKNHVTTNYAEPKDKLIVWAASHCGLLRDDVVHKIAHFLPLTVIGRCAKLFNQKTPNFCKRGSNDCSSFLRRFKFYLAFENAMCTDYITEKYWETPFDNNMVPIVLGSNYDFKVAIPGSYINILDFQNIEALVKYIEYLDRNDTAYNEYFQWKTKYTRIEPGEKSWTCQLCANIYNDSLPKKVYTNLGTYWGIDSNCNRSLESMIRSIIRE